MIPKKTDVRSQNTHVEMEVRENMSVMTNGHRTIRIGVRWRYFQKNVETEVVIVGREGIWAVVEDVCCARVVMNS